MNWVIFWVLLIASIMQYSPTSKITGIAFAAAHGLHEVIFSGISGANYYIYYLSATIIDFSFIFFVTKQQKTPPIVIFLALTCTISSILHLYGLNRWWYEQPTMYDVWYMWLYLLIVAALVVGGVSGGIRMFSRWSGNAQLNRSRRLPPVSLAGQGGGR